MEHIHNCGNCAHFGACDSILKRYAGLSGIAKDGPACGNYAVRIEDILGDDYDLDRLRELVEADRDGRCVVLPAGGHTEKDGENALKSAMNTCQHRNAQGICTNHDSVFFGSRVDDGTCPVWGNYDAEMWGDE